MIRVTGLCKKLPNGKELLKDISFEVKRGEFVGVLGASGAGKSLTLRCMVGLVQPTAGCVDFEVECSDGKRSVKRMNELKGRELREARRQIGVIFQGASLVRRLTALENVMIGRLGFISSWRTWLYGFKDSEAAEAYEALKRVKMQDYASRRVGNLSGGEQQRVAIARAIFQNPSAYFADEPVSSLDPKNAHRIMGILKPLAAEKPVLGVFHQPHLTAEFCSRVIAVKDGQIVYDGDPKLSRKDLEMIYGVELEDLDPQTGFVGAGSGSNGGEKHASVGAGVLSPQLNT